MLSFHTERQMLPHPILLEARQIAPNQILLNYDQRTDLASAMNVSNYWIRSNMERPAGIATVGMREALTASNAISPNFGMITPADNSNMRFVMTFRVNAMSGVMYTVLPCFVNLEGMTGFRGENWAPFSRNMFIGM
ncbi:hypothetical protein M3661_07245 [Paenibacillus sp. MER 180]|uniref:hypothetical protein n=1 Tax=unclassified Paenibacillus TaxID=185978 RepID=UPI00080653B4|nr:MULTISPECIES: hypothetical protein [unclassified Paenibacillus]MCM3289923.1 hypothetical protein [Paenibacillus sp. MER 180]OBY76328.1 hypothetical protein BBG47_27825 [Paenibacillus sp. KS1]